jgi:hypothetical protein
LRRNVTAKYSPSVSRINGSSEDRPGIQLSGRKGCDSMNLGASLPGLG